MTSEYISEDF